MSVREYPARRVHVYSLCLFMQPDSSTTPGQARWLVIVVDLRSIGYCIPRQCPCAQDIRINIIFKKITIFSNANVSDIPYPGSFLRMG